MRYHCGFAMGFDRIRIITVVAQWDFMEYELSLWFFQWDFVEYALSLRFFAMTFNRICIITEGLAVGFYRIVLQRYFLEYALSL